MRSWLVIPAMGAVAAAGAIALEAGPMVVGSAALASAALVAAIRVLAGNSPASLSGAIVAPLLAIALSTEHGGLEAVPCLAFVAVCWTIAELGRTTASPLVAMLPAITAAVLEPGAIALVPLAATRLVTAPWQRPRWVIAVPIAGALAVIFAIVAGLARTGAFAAIGARWFGAPPEPIAAATLAPLLAGALGPLVAVAAVAGLGVLARPRLAELAIAACVAGALAIDLRAGAVGPLTLGLAALSTGLALGRFAGLIRIGSGQALAGATAGMLLLVPPAWSAIEHGPRVAIAEASR